MSNDEFIIPKISDFHYKRGQGNEAKRVLNRLKDFNYENSETWKILKRKFSSKITHNELKSIALVCCKLHDLTLDREASRDNRVLIKWFDEKWSIISQTVDSIVLRDEKGRPITGENELTENPP